MFVARRLEAYGPRFVDAIGKTR